MPDDYSDAVPDEIPDDLIARGGVFHELEVEFACPCCLAPISVLVDPSVPGQRYIEDCEVCCRPILISYAVEGDEVVAFEAQRQG